MFLLEIIVVTFFGFGISLLLIAVVLTDITILKFGLGLILVEFIIGLYLFSKDQI